MGHLLSSKSRQDPHVVAVSAPNSTPFIRTTASPPNTIIIKYANDITILGLRMRQDIGMRQEIGIQRPSQLYGLPINDILVYDEEKDFILNIDMTKEILMDFKKNPPPLQPLAVKGK